MTIAVSNIPALSLSVSSPRIAAIEFPLSQTIGRPGDTLGQAAVLRASLQAIEGIDQPGGLVHLPFDWSEDTRENKSPALQPPPITRYLKSHPWDLPKFMSRQVPEKYRSAP